VAGYLTKPIKQADLRKAILEALGTPVPSEAAESGQAPATSLPTAAPAQALRARRRRLRILVAEDNPVNQKLAATLLQKQGHLVTVAGNGGEALAALERQAFDLVLMDVQMPGMDGLEATRRIREREGAGPHLPIIAMTAYAMKGDRERCLAAGMNGYLTKPVHAADLLRAVEATVPPENAPPTEDEVQWPAELAEVEDDRELVRELAAVFLGECPKWLAEIRSALACGDAPRLQLTAHTLKGSLTIFAAKTAAAAALRLEALGRAGDLHAARKALAALEEELARLQPILAAIARPVRDRAAVSASTPAYS
jgi:CheY-like chemotaxis protein